MAAWILSSAAGISTIEKMEHNQSVLMYDCDKGNALMLHISFFFFFFCFVFRAKYERFVECNLCIAHKQMWLEVKFIQKEDEHELIAKQCPRY